MTDGQFENGSSPAGQPMWMLVAILAMIASVALAGKLLWQSRLGLDFSDEGLYLNLIANPSGFPGSSTHFGYIYHPLYLLVGGSIAGLRACNIALTLALAWLTGFTVLRSIALSSGGRISWSGISASGTAIVLAGAASIILLLTATTWLPTPSYNSLTFQALLIGAIGAALVGSSPSSMAGWFIIGVAGWLAFIAKPPSCAALGVATFLYLVAAGKLSLRGLAISVLNFVLLMIGFAWLVTGSVVRFVQEMQQGLATVSLLGSGHTLAGIFRFDRFSLSPPESLILISLAGTLVALVWAAASDHRALNHFGALATSALALSSLLVTFGRSPIDFVSTRFQGVQFLSMPLGAAAVAALLLLCKRGSPVSRAGLAIAAFLAVLPHVFAFGTIMEYWQAGAAAAYFWAASGIALLAAVLPAHRYWQSLLPAAVIALAVTSVFIDHGTRHPYRQSTPLNLDTVSVRFAATGAHLLLSRDFAAYIAALQMQARTAGFTVGDPVVDLTGHYPAALNALGARPLGAAWMIGGYPGSDAFAAKMLQFSSCSDLAVAWVLTEPAGERKLSPEILRKNGIDLDRDYRVVGELDSPTGTYPTSYKQYLLKPVRETREANSACEAARRQSP